MRRPSLLLGALLGGLTSLPLIALSYLGQQWAALPFIPFDLFDWLARVLPGQIITNVIDLMVRLIMLLGLGPISNVAKQMEQLQGILLVIAGGVVFGVVIAWLMRRTGRPGGSVGLGVGLIGFGIFSAIEINLGNSIADQPIASLFWLALLILGWGVSLGTWLARKALSAAAPPLTTEFRAARRKLLLEFAGGSVGIALAAWGLGRLAPRLQATGAGEALSQILPTPSRPNGKALVETPSSPLSTPAASAVAGHERIAPAPGTRLDLTPNDQFYRIDIDALPPAIDESNWKLEVTGMFDRPRSLTLADLMTYPAVTQPITLSCISNPIGGDLISTSNWTGVPLRVVLKDLGVRPEATALNIKAVDGFYESVAMEDMMDPRTLLVYGMNGDTLPQAHGFPLRIYIPNRYGMKQPKWITSIEATDHHGPGYWVVRGWSAEARPHIVSIIDTVATDHIENGRIPVGGIAWAGDRGIQQVEVQVDNGQWVAADLLTPPLGPLTWIQWRYNWPVPPSGRYTIRVRATDGTGTLQIGQYHAPYPNGATGYDEVTVTI